MGTGKGTARSDTEAGRIPRGWRQGKQDFQSIAFAFLYLGRSLQDGGKLEEAAAAFEESLSLRKQHLPEGDWRIPNVPSLLGDCRRRRGRFEDAEQLLVESFEKLEQNPETPPIRKREALRRLIDLYEAWGKPETAEEYRKLLPDPAK